MSDDNLVRRLPLLKALKDLAKCGTTLDASIVTTYAFNGLFYEEVLLRAFKRAGSRLNIVLVDARQLSEAISDPLRRPSLAGVEYLLAPISLQGAFHPKLIALLSETAPILALGSHNATDAGLSHNEEITAYWGPKGSVDAGVLQGTVEYAMKWLSSSGALDHEVLAGISGRLKALMPKAPSPDSGEVSLIASTAEASLWRQLLTRVVGTVDRVTLLGPYFDAQMDFLKTIATDLAPSEIIVGLQPETTVMPRPDLSPPMTRFVDASSIGALWPQDGGVGFAHGKAIAIEGSGGVVVSLGSANPTGAAWLPRPRWNAEANLCLTGSAAVEAFSALGLNLIAKAPSIAEGALTEIGARSSAQRAEDGGSLTPPPPPVVIGRVTDGGILLVDYTAPNHDDWTLSMSGGPAKIAILKAIEGATMVDVNDRPILAGLHQLHSASGALVHILLNDAHALKAATTSRDGARILDHLGSLKDGAGLVSLLDLLDRHILSADSQAGSNRSVGPSGTTEADGEAPFGPRGVAMPVNELTDLRRPRLNDGLIAEIIAALIRALSTPRTIPERDGDAPDLDEADAGDAPSSDDLASNLENSDRTEIDWPRLVAACRKRLSTMLKRLEARLDEAAEGNYPPGWALGRLVVVLSLLTRLRAHPPQTSNAINGRVRPESLVSKDQLQLAFNLAVRAMYGKGGLAIELESQPDTRAAEERRLIDNLLLWFGREIGAEYRRQPGERSDDEAMQARADLGLIVMSAAAYDGLDDWAAARDPWLSMWDDAPVVSEDWTRRHLAYGSALQLMRGIPRAASRRTPVVGDLVRWDGEPDLPYVISSVGGHKMSLTKPAGGLGERTKVLSSSLSLLDMDEQPANP